MRGQIFFPESEELRFSALRYSAHLIAMREPSLWELSRNEPNAEMYRLTLLPSFSGPISVRVTVGTAQDVTLVTKLLDGKGGYDPGKLLTDRVVQLSKSQSAALQKELLRRRPIWDEPTVLPFDGRITLDGTVWIVEWLQKGRYHLVVRTSPPHNDTIYAFGMFLAKELAGLKLGKDVQ